MKRNKLKLVFYLGDKTVFFDDSASVLIHCGIEYLRDQFPNYVFSVVNTRIYQWYNEQDRDVVAEVKLNEV